MAAMTFHKWLTFLLAAAVLLAIPGPTVLMVVGQSLGAGRRTFFLAPPCLSHRHRGR